MGGSGGRLDELIDWSWQQLYPGGRPVMTFILQENLNAALDICGQKGIEQVDCLQLNVSSLTALGSGHYFKPNNPVLLSPVRRKKTMAETFDPVVWFVGAGPGDRELITPRATACCSRPRW